MLNPKSFLIFSMLTVALSTVASAEEFLDDTAKKETKAIQRELFLLKQKTELANAKMDLCSGDKRRFAHEDDCKGIAASPASLTPSALVEDYAGRMPTPLMPFSAATPVPGHSFEVLSIGQTGKDFGARIRTDNGTVFVRKNDPVSNGYRVRQINATQVTLVGGGKTLRLGVGQ